MSRIGLLGIRKAYLGRLATAAIPTPVHDRLADLLEGEDRIRQTLLGDEARHPPDHARTRARVVEIPSTGLELRIP